MSFPYVYSLSTNFGGNLNSFQLVNEIAANPIPGSVCVYIDTSGDVVTIYMSTSLDGTQLTALNARVAAHVAKDPLYAETTTSGTYGTMTTFNTTQTSNRIITFPDTTDTVCCCNTADSMTNKTIVSSTNNVISRGLWVASGATSVTVFNSSAPNAGQVLRALGNTSAVFASLSATDIASGVFGVTNGGTGLSSYVAGDLLYASGTSTLSTLSDIATGNSLLSGGVGVAPLWGKIGLATHVSGVLPVANGGTGLSAYAVGDILYASGATTLTALADVATGSALISGGVTTAPSWGKIGLTTHVSGTLPVANGGTGATTLTSGNILRGNGTGAITATLAAPTGAILGTTDSQVLTNKTATDSTNNITAKGLFSATTTVAVSAATAPSANQVLMATSSTNATWQAPLASYSYVNATDNSIINSTTYTLIGSMTITPVAGSYYVSYTGQASKNGTVDHRVQVFAGGTGAAESIRQFLDTQTGNVVIAGVTTAVVTVNGAQAIEIKGYSSGGNTTVTNRSMTIIKVA